MESPNSNQNTMVFNLGKFEHPIYHSDMELGGVIPLLPSAHQTISQIPLIQPNYIDKVCEEMFQMYRGMWENELDEEIMEIIKTEILLCAFTTPKHVLQPNLKSELHILTKFLLISRGCLEMMAELSLDELASNMSTFDFDSKESQMIQGIAQAIKNANDEGAPQEDYPCVLPRLKALLPYITDFIRSMNRNIDFNARIKPFKKEAQKSFSTMLIMAKKGNKEEGMNDHNMMRLKNRSFLELLALYNNGEVPIEKRKNDLMKDYIENVANVTSLVESLLSLKEDIALEKGDKSSLLKKVLEGMSLREAFQGVHNQILNHLKEVQEVGKKIIIQFPKDQNIENYVKTGEDLINGQLYWYAHKNGFTVK